MKAKKVNQKVIKDFKIGNIDINVSDNGESKMYKIYSKFTFFMNSVIRNKEQSVRINNRFFYNNKNDDKKIITEQIKNIDAIIENLNELKEALSFTINESDINYEREEKLNRIKK